MSIASCGLPKHVPASAPSSVSTDTPDDIEALRIKDFARRYGISKSQTFIEIREGRLLARKAGGRTLILKCDADHWVRSLPFSKPCKPLGRPPRWMAKHQRMAAGTYAA